MMTMTFNTCNSRDKDSLWQKNDQLEHVQKLTAASKWMDNHEATRCLHCQAEFSMLLRRVCVTESHSHIYRAHTTHKHTSHIHHKATGCLHCWAEFSMLL